MKRWHWFSFALMAVVLVAALIGVPRLGGGTERAQAGDPISVVLDMNVTNGSGPCDPAHIDTSRSETVGDPSYKIAVCLVGAGAEPAGWEFSLLYDDTRNTCVVPASCTGTALDCNPDANTGTTTFSTPNLGQDTDDPAVSWDCSSGGIAAARPKCDTDPATGAGHGRAHISCFTTDNPTLAIGTGVSAPIAEVTFSASAGGVDTLSLDAVAIFSPAGAAILNCPGGPGTCAGGTDTKTGGGTSTPEPTATTVGTLTPSPTPGCNLTGEGLPTCTPTPRARTETPTPVPTETATAAPSGGGGGGGGNPPPPPPAGGTGPVVSPPSTGDGSGGVPWVTWLAISVMAGFGAISLVSGGLYLRRARMRQ